MNQSLKTWFGQVTTGHGFMILGPTLLAVMSGTMPWAVAVPLLAAGVIGLAWPENAQLKQAVQTATADIEAVVTAYQAGLSDAGPKGSVPSFPRPVASIFAVLVLAGLSLAACADQTEAERTATVNSVASGAKCVADATAKAAASATTTDPDTTKAMNSAEAVGSTLSTDPACAAALDDIPAATTP